MTDLSIDFVQPGWAERSAATAGTTTTARRVPSEEGVGVRIDGIA